MDATFSGLWISKWTVDCGLRLCIARHGAIQCAQGGIIKHDSRRQGNHLPSVGSALRMIFFAAPVQLLPAFFAHAYIVWAFFAHAYIVWAFFAHVYIV